MNPFDAMYDGTPPWDVGHPQPAFVELHARGGLRGRVLDSGCGTGDLAIWLALQGMDVVGVDLSGRAIERARGKARAAAARVDLRQHDALRVDTLGVAFDTVLDCGLMHTLTDKGWTLYLRMLARVLRPGGLLHVLCFSEHEPDWGGPRRVKESELRRAFQGGWWLEELRETRFETHRSPAGVRAWMCSATWNGKPAAGVQ
ncbi:MAG: class I SAM-dependent methyltransferase [Deltaproteobacteria bacterium]|nr:class I SAM-dependent methyltransferase [Deltaproteobacteria bacterium]